MTVGKHSTYLTPWLGSVIPIVPKLSVGHREKRSGRPGVLVPHETAALQAAQMKRLSAICPVPPRSKSPGKQGVQQTGPLQDLVIQSATLLVHVDSNLTRIVRPVSDLWKEYIVY
jgi:hypothetical protein